MSTTSVLSLASVLEAGTGLLLIIDPGLVVTLLLGQDLTRQGQLLGNLAGIALLALGLACWPGSQSNPAAWRGMLAYNLLATLFLAYLGCVMASVGKLLWPAVALHSMITVLLYKAPAGKESNG